MFEAAGRNYLISQALHIPEYRNTTILGAVVHTLVFTLNRFENQYYS
jgi:hypothetical protein